jgi:hypothetical protein
MVMPFGKYRGQLVDQIPVEYLEWVQRHIPLREPLRSAVYRMTSAPTISDDQISAEKVQTVYHRLARKYHPDLGGNVVAMQAINEFRELLSR